MANICTKWHPNEIINKVMHRKRPWGGGITYHEIDLSNYLFGNVIKVNAFKIKNN